MKITRNVAKPDGYVECLFSYPYNSLVVIWCSSVWSFSTGSMCKHCKT
jgi:hypothetical protein